jgi:hypothetical protein
MGVLITSNNTLELSMPEESDQSSSLIVFNNKIHLDPEDKF